MPLKDFKRYNSRSTTSGFGGHYGITKFGDDESDDNSDSDNDGGEENELPPKPNNPSYEEELIWKARRDVLKKCDDINEISDVIGGILDKYGIRYCTTEVYDYCLEELR